MSAGTNLVRYAEAHTSIDQWLLWQGIHATDSATLWQQICDRLRADGVPINFAALFVRQLHPQLLGRAVLWRAFGTGPKEWHREHGNDAYRDSVINHVIEDGVDAVVEPDVHDTVFPSLGLDNSHGLALVMALPATGPLHHACLFVLERDAQSPRALLDELRELRLSLASAAQSLEVRRTMFRLMRLYVGERATESILGGSIRRGDFETISGALMLCDAHGFTERAETESKAALTAALNDYLADVIITIEASGGEVLKLIGDGVLAIFVEREFGDERSTCEVALDAAHRIAMRRAGDFTRGIALHFGEAAFGNVGAESRLDFTVIGASVNRVSRIEGLTRSLNETILTSETFATLHGGPFRSLGQYQLRGIKGSVDIYAP